MTNGHPGFGTVTFSAMATRGHQDATRKGMGSHPLAAPWSLRRDLCVSYLAQGGFDFIGLKHCDLDPGKPDCAFSYFLNGLNRPAHVYDSVDAAVRKTPEEPQRGDCVSIIYRSDIWRADDTRSGPVWHETVPPENQKGGQGGVFNFAVFDRIGPADGIRPHKLHVYNIRMRNAYSDALDLFRAHCLGEILAHMADNAETGVPVVLLTDTNSKVAGSVADQLFMGHDADTAGLAMRPKLRLSDSYIDLHPDAHGNVRTQHNFKNPGEIAGSERNNRVLYHGGLHVTGADISTWSGEDGNWPSYHYPVEGWFRTV